MKNFLLICMVVLLPGCAAVEKVQQIWPRDHDPAMVSSFITLSVYLDSANCAKKETLADARKEAEWLNRYSEFRSDPQKVSTKAIVDNLDKAINSEVIACQRWLNLTKTRMKIIKEAWSGR